MKLQFSLIVFPSSFFFDVQISATLNTEGELEITFSLGNDTLSFDDFFIVYNYAESNDAGSIPKPECDDGGSSTGGRLEEVGEAVVTLESDKSWGLAIATCPKTDNKARLRLFSRILPYRVLALNSIKRRPSKADGFLLRRLLRTATPRGSC
jgi:hypothetical protein